MTAEHILQSDLLDIVFEGRNKQYGAYELRRTYHRRLKKGLIGMFFTVVSGAAGYLYSEGYNTDSNIQIELTNPTQLNVVPLTEKPPAEQPLPKPKRAAAQNVATVTNFIPLISPDAPETEVHETDQLDTSAIGMQEHPGDVQGNGEVVQGDTGSGGTTTGETNGGASAAEPALPAGPIDMGLVDEMPLYPGGMQALVRFMVNNLTSELEPGIKYVIRAQFVIDEAGKVSDAVIVSSDDATLNPQVLKALRKMKTWKPGRWHGRPVAVRFTIPVTFVGAEE